MQAISSKVHTIFHYAQSCPLSGMHRTQFQTEGPVPGGMEAPAVSYGTPMRFSASDRVQRRAHFLPGTYVSAAAYAWRRVILQRQTRRHRTNGCVNSRDASIAVR